MALLAALEFGDTSAVTPKAIWFPTAVLCSTALTTLTVPRGWPVVKDWNWRSLLQVRMI